MKTPVRSGRWIAGLAALCLAGLGLWWFLAHRGNSAEKKEAEEEPTAQVRTAPLRRGEIERTLVAYGTAAAAPGGTRSIAYPFESRVVAVQVNIGQTVTADDPLLQIEPSADARLALDSARAATQAADRALLDAQNRFKARLATNADLAAAESAARDARLKFESLQGRTPDAQGVVKAPSAGVVTKLPAAPGSVVPAGGPLAELAVESRFEARLGLNPADAGKVKAGQTVRLAPVGSRHEATEKTAPFQGKVRVVGASVDPATRLVDAFVSLDGTEAPVLIGTYLEAKVVLETKTALLAPRAAVLPQEGEEGHAVLFTVKDGKAVRHEVETGLDDGENVEILGNGGALPEGTAVVTEGAYELEDKMEVEVVTGDATKKEGGKPDDEEDKKP